MDPVSPVLKRRVNVPNRTNRRDRAMAAHRSGSAAGLDPARIMPATSLAPSRGGSPLNRVATFTDSASDLDPGVATAKGIRIVPLLVSFGSETFKAGLEMSTAEFWDRMVAPDAPFPKTAASSPGEFKDAYEAA